MQKYLTLILGFLLSASENSFSQTPDSTVNSLLAINENQFSNKPLDSIIAVLPSGYIDMRIVAPTHRNTARLLRILYPSNVWIDLHVRNFVHMNPVDTNRLWNIALMRKECLYKTVIFKHVECYRNCDIY